MPVEVHLRTLTELDLPLLFDYQKDPVAVHMVAFQLHDPSDWDAFSAKWAKRFAEDNFNAMVIVVDGQLAGNIVSFIAPWSGKLEVGYWLGREFWGRGIATQALGKFLELETTRPLHARTAKDNIGSTRVLTKCGFAIVGYETAFANARGEEIEETLMRLDGDVNRSVDSPTSEAI